MPALLIVGGQELNTRFPCTLVASLPPIQLLLGSIGDRVEGSQCPITAVAGWDKTTLFLIVGNGHGGIRIPRQAYACCSLLSS